MVEKIVKEGWGKTIGRIWHYFQFREGYGMTDSICGKIGFYSIDNDLELGNDTSSDNCMACRKALEKLRFKEKFIKSAFNCKCPKCGGEKAVREKISKVIVCTECGYRGL